MNPVPATLGWRASPPNQKTITLLYNHQHYLQTQLKFYFSQLVSAVSATLGWRTKPLTSYDHISTLLRNHTLKSHMTRKKIIIFTDSRGRGLQPYLESRFPRQQLIIKVLVFPGANVDKLAEQVNKKVDITHDLVIICGGICSLTSKVKEDNKKILKYISSEENTLHIKDTLTSLAGKLQGRIIISTIPPASLNRYYKHYNDNQEPPTYLKEQQSDLLQDLSDINQCITTLNKAATFKNLDIHSKCFNKTLDSNKKGQRNTERRRKIFLENELTDGVHPNSNLQSKWFQRFNAVINAWLSNISSSETDTELSEPWDYKRRTPNPPSTPQ